MFTRLGKIICLCVTFGLPTGAVRAQEFVTAKALLSDDDFYRLVACAAPPGGKCQKRFVRWSKDDARDVSLRIVQIDKGYPLSLQTRVKAYIDRTLEELNDSGANFRLRHAATKETPDIRVFLLNLPHDSKIAGTGLPWFDGQDLQVARMQMGWRDDGTVIECAVALSRDIAWQDVQSILLEEIAQCMGLITDIGGRTYQEVSIFSELANSVSKLGPQDVMALRRHYP